MWDSLIKRHSTVLTCFVLFVLVVAARLLYASQHFVFSQDQARDAYLMKVYAERGEWLVAYGPKASVGNFYLPPFYYQLHLLVSQAFGHPPLVMQWLITIVESLTPVILYLWLKMLTKPKIALVAAFAYFLFLLPTSFGTAAWNPNMIPFFSTLAAWMWFRVILKKESRPILVASLAVMIAVQLHYQSVVLLPFAVLVCLYDLKRDWRRWPWWLGGGLLAVATLVPYGIAEVKSGWQNTAHIVAYFTQDHSRYFDRVSKVGYVVSFLPAFVEKVLVNRELPMVLLGRVVFFVGVILLGLKVLKDRRWQWVGLYFLTILIMLRVYKGDKLEYYLSTLYVLPAFFVALAWRLNRYVTGALLISLAVVSGLFYSQFRARNSLTDLSQAVAYIDQAVPEGESFSLLFQNDDLINVFSYKLAHNPEFNIQPGSFYLVEICDVGVPCAWEKALSCTSSAGYTYSILLKQKAGYTPLEKAVIGHRYQIVVGRLQNPITEVGYELNAGKSSFGTDLLLDGIYQR